MILGFDLNIYNEIQTYPWVFEI